MKQLKTYGVLSLLILLAACASPIQRTAPAERDNIIIDPEVRYAFDVTELLDHQQSQPDGSHLLKIQFAVKARSDAKLAWKVTWFDDQGQTVAGVSEGYRRATLLSGQLRYFDAVAPAASVTDYQLHLRSPE